MRVCGRACRIRVFTFIYSRCWTCATLVKTKLKGWAEQLWTFSRPICDYVGASKDVNFERGENLGMGSADDICALVNRYGLSIL